MTTGTSMREQLAKMTLRQLSLWLMVMLDPAYKTLYLDRSLIPSENEYPKSVKCLIEKSISIFQRLLAADCGDYVGLQKDIVAVLDAAHHISAISSGQAWVGMAVYPVMLGLEVLLDELIGDRSSGKVIDRERTQRGLRDFELAVPHIAQVKGNQAYYDRLNSLGATLNAVEILADDKPFGQPIPADLIKRTLEGTYFDENWRRTHQ